MSPTSPCSPPLGPGLVPLPYLPFISALCFQTGCLGTPGSHHCFRLTCSHEAREPGARQRTLQESLIVQAWANFSWPRLEGCLADWKLPPETHGCSRGRAHADFRISWEAVPENMGALGQTEHQNDNVNSKSENSHPAVLSCSPFRSMFQCERDVIRQKVCMPCEQMRKSRRAHWMNTALSKLKTTTCS